LENQALKPEICESFAAISQAAKLTLLPVTPLKLSRKVLGRWRVHNAVSFKKFFHGNSIRRQPIFSFDFNGLRHF
jgi:hypothetical protein